MRRYISNKGLRLCYQHDYTQNFPGQDGQIVTITKQPLIECVFEPLLGGPFGNSAWDLPAAYRAYSRVTGEVATYANIKERFDPDQGVTNEFLHEPVMVQVHGLDRGKRKLGIVKNDETVIEMDQDIDPAAGLWVFDVDIFCTTNPHAKGLEEDIEKFLDSDRSGRDHVKVEEPALRLPFNGYDRIETAKRIGMLASELGVDPDRIVAYETAKPRDMSPEILEEMAKLKARQTEKAELEATELVNA